MLTTSRYIRQCPSRVELVGRRLPNSRGWTNSKLLTVVRSKHYVGGNQNESSARHILPARWQNLNEQGFVDYPRLQFEGLTSNIARFLSEHVDPMSDGDIAAHCNPIRFVAHIKSVRSAGSKLLFLDVIELGGSTKPIQILVNQADLSKHDEHSSSKSISVASLRKLLQPGDCVQIVGKPCKTSTGQASIRVEQEPKLLAPTLHTRPASSSQLTSDHHHDRHFEMLVDSTIKQTIKLRSRVMEYARRYLNDAHFLEVQTPILAASAGGASARPFVTTASEFESRKLSLRIAPELWLKRLVVGGMPQIYEIGPSFRNEGIDRTHNPEFTTMEFYAVNWDLAKLMSETEQMMQYIEASLLSETEDFEDIPSRSKALFGQSFQVLDFIPALEAQLGVPLPSLSEPDAHEKIIQLYHNRGDRLPKNPTLPRLIDDLCSTHLEFKTTEATWIINPPECLSPLAKSFSHPDLPHQRVAARAELFVRNKELVNCYEEENSPVEQRRKFVDQQRLAKPDQGVQDEEAHVVDEDYCKALEWGMPPTGGWGCGIDRLVMLLGGKDNISDVLSFGNLRKVTWSATQAAQVADANRKAKTEPKG